MTRSLPKFGTLYTALINNDSSFEGIFFFGVKTTGIFCRPTCPAKKPKPENVEFFRSVEEALSQGYRPCKVCRPLSYKDKEPAWLQPLLDEIHTHPDMRIRDRELQQKGIDPHRVRRWFQKHYGITFQAYQRSLRIGQAYDTMRNGSPVSETAFDSGYNSLSGFTDMFKKTTGFSPNKSSQQQLITTMRILTPVGPMIGGATKDGICMLEYDDRKMLQSQLLRITKFLHARFVPGVNALLNILQDQLEEYFSGLRKDFDLPLVFTGTSFQKEVWQSLLKIPYGETRSYQEQAAMVGNPAAVRAVAGANGDNRISIIVPCHRVIGKNGKLTGYGGGLWRKKYLLDHEHKYVSP